MHTTILLCTEVTSKPVLSFLTWTLLTAMLALRMLDPTEQSLEASTGYVIGWVTRKKLPYLPYSHFQLQANNILELSTGVPSLSSASFWEKPRTKKEGGENHNTSCCSSFIVLPLVLTLPNQFLLCSSLPHSYSNRNTSCLCSVHLFFILDQTE